MQQPPSQHLPQKNIRRRFHHFLLSKRKSGAFRQSVAIKRPSRAQSIIPPALRRAGFFIIAGGIFAGLVYVVFFSSFFAIAKVSVEKNGNAVSGSALSPFLEKLKGKNILFMRTSPLVREIEQIFRNEVLLVEIKKSLPKRVTVKIEEYPAVLNLRVKTPEKEQKFVINQIGYAIFENAEQKEVPVLFLQSEKQFAVKTLAIEPKKLDPMVRAFTQFTALFGMKVPEGEWKKTQRELHLKTEKGFFVWIDLTADIDRQLLKLKRALTKLDIYNEPLAYIDLRIAGADSEKVIFKRK